MSSYSEREREIIEGLSKYTYISRLDPFLQIDFSDGRLISHELVTSFIRNWPIEEKVMLFMDTPLAYWLVPASSRSSPDRMDSDLGVDEYAAAYSRGRIATGTGFFPTNPLFDLDAFTGGETFLSSNAAFQTNDEFYQRYTKEFEQILLRLSSQGDFTRLVLSDRSSFYSEKLKDALWELEDISNKRDPRKQVLGFKRDCQVCQLYTDSIFGSIAPVMAMMAKLMDVIPDNLDIALEESFSQSITGLKARDCTLKYLDNPLLQTFAEPTNLNSCFGFKDNSSGLMVNAVCMFKLMMPENFFKFKKETDETIPGKCVIASESQVVKQFLVEISTLSVYSGCLKYGISDGRSCMLVELDVEELERQFQTGELNIETINDNLDQYVPLKDRGFEFNGVCFKVSLPTKVIHVIDDIFEEEKLRMKFASFMYIQKDHFSQQKRFRVLVSRIISGYNAIARGLLPSYNINDPQRFGTPLENELSTLAISPYKYGNGERYMEKFMDAPLGEPSHLDDLVSSTLAQLDDDTRCPYFKFRLTKYIHPYIHEQHTMMRQRSQVFITEPSLLNEFYDLAHMTDETTSRRIKKLINGGDEIVLKTSDPIHWREYFGMNSLVTCHYIYCPGDFDLTPHEKAKEYIMDELEFLAILNLEPITRDIVPQILMYGRLVDPIFVDGLNFPMINGYFIAMTKIKRKPWEECTEAELHEFLEKELIPAFEKLHSLNIIHGDINHSNYMMSAEEGNHAKIIDFQLSTRSHDPKRKLQELEVVKRDFKSNVLPLVTR